MSPTTAGGDEFDIDVNMDEILGDPTEALLDEEMVVVDDDGHDPVDSGSDFYADIQDELDKDELATFVADLEQAISRDRESRTKYDEDLNAGLKELGFDRGEASSSAFPGASTVRTPLLAKASVEYLARAKKELFPQSGAVRATYFSDQDAEKDLELEPVRVRKEAYVNHMISIGIEDYADEMDKTLQSLPLLGSVFRKVWHDGSTVRVDMIPVTDFLVPYSTKSLASAPRKTHVLRLHKHEILDNFRSGLWKKAELQSPDESAPELDGSSVRQTIDRVVGLSRDSSGEDDRYVIYEVHTYASFEKKDDDDDDGEEALLPYIVTFDSATKTVMSVRRNWVEDDESRRPREYFVHYKFLPWLDSFYGIGFIHLMGGISKAASGSLRALMDSAMASNMPGGLVNQKATTSGQGGGNQMTFSPFTWTKINVPTDGGKTDIRNHFLPFAGLNQPSGVLFQLLGFLMEQGEKFGSVNVKDMMGADQQAPVGTTMALIEQQSIVFSHIHERQHRSFARELSMMDKRWYEYMDTDTQSTAVGSITVGRDDFDGRVAIVPASDPSVFSSIQRVTQAQAVAQLAQQAQDQGIETDMRAVYMRMSTALGIKDVEEIFPEPQPPEPPPPMLPAQEFAAAINGEPVIAHKGQNHQAHIEFLMVTMQDPLYSPIIGKARPNIESLIAMHAGLQRIEEIEAAIGQPLPDPSQGPIPPEVQAAISQASVQIAQQMAASRPPSDGNGEDALAAAAMAEVERKAQDDSVKAQIEVAKIEARREAERENRELKAQLESMRIEMDAALRREKMQSDMQRNGNDAEIRASDAAARAQVESTRIAADAALKERDIEARERMERERLASAEAMKAASLASAEQIAAAKIMDARRRHEIDVVSRSLGDQRKIRADMTKNLFRG